MKQGFQDGSLVGKMIPFCHFLHINGNERCTAFWYRIDIIRT